MPNMTFAVSEAMHKEMRRHKNIKWSEVVRTAIEKEIEKQQMLAHWDDVFKDSRMTIEDAVRMGREVRRAAAARSRKARE